MKFFPYFLLVFGIFWQSAHAQGIIYRCPGNIYTNDSKAADQSKCTVVSSANLTVVSVEKFVSPNNVPSKDFNANINPTSNNPLQNQKDLDQDRVRILQDELRAEQFRLQTLRKQYQNGRPERTPTEIETQYVARAEQIRLDIERSENNIEALKRELQKVQ